VSTVPTRRVIRKKIKRTRPKASPKVSPSALLAEGVFEVGRPSGTSLLFVLTESRLLVLHASSLPDRVLDDYAVQLAVSWIIHQGISSAFVARYYLCVSQDTLRRALADAGYRRLSSERHEDLARARASRRFGNRRGRLVRSDQGPGSP
jgi:hypothetical protein